MEFKEISKSKLREGDFLWRYIDLHKLINFGITKELHFTRTDKFQDPFEGITYKLLADRHFARTTKVTNPSIERDVRDQFEKNQKATLEKYERESVVKQRTQFINCWLRSQRESVAMWNLYSNRDSVALRVNAKQFIDYFKLNIELQPDLLRDCEFICGSVSYLKINPIDPFEKYTLPKYSSFKKDVAYDFEKEFRLLIATPTSKAESNPEFIRYKITQNFIDLLEIICHPEMDNWKFDNINSLCEKLKLPAPSRSKTEMRI
jgi:hypothetical protein